MPKKEDKFHSSIQALEHALSFRKKAQEDHFYFSGIAKSFEVCFEYAWKDFKRKALEEGLEVNSPKEAIKSAGKLGIIENVNLWLDFFNDRNIAVHDYLGLPDDVYLKTIEKFFQEVKKL